MPNPTPSPRGAATPRIARRPTSVLISGAGIAGSTLAYWLARSGFDVTTVERSAGTRSSGNPVDVRGAAIEVVERMGILSQLREARTRATGVSFLSPRGRPVGRIDLRAMQAAAGSRELEIPRADLAAILADASRNSTELLTGDRIVGLAQDRRGVDVAFAHAAPRRFDLVIGADGLHSGVRRLAFGPERDYVRHQGMYVATLPLPEPGWGGHDVLLYNRPGTTVSVHPGRTQALAAFMFRSPELGAAQTRDLDAQKHLILRTFASDRWRVPELLQRVKAAPDLYFDSVSRVRIPSWSAGRVALLGDAASCVSLLGEGSSLAIAGAATLAAELAADPDDPAGAFRRYESAHRALVAPKQKGMAQAARLLVPATGGGIAARNLAVRLWSPAARTRAWFSTRRPGAAAP